MTSKFQAHHYEVIAEVLHNHAIDPDDFITATEIMHDFIAIFTDDNPRFDDERFRMAVLRPTTTSKANSRLR